MPDLLFEIGTEEIPAAYMKNALEQLRLMTAERLSEERISYDEVKTYGTPRRLTTHVVNIADKQSDAERLVRGPNVKVAYDADGKPTKALEGFVRSQNVAIDKIETTATPQGEYIIVRKMDIGKPSEDVLSAVLPDIVKNLAFPKFMRWGDAGIRFVRPLRWFTALLGSNVIEFELEGIKSGNATRGHRFLSSEFITAENPDDYFNKLSKAWVMIDPSERARTITEGAYKVSESIGMPVIEDDLLEENVFLVEYPTALLGQFDPAYLDLPEPVLITAMKKHEKFFPIRDSEGKLTSYFVSIRNGNSDGIDTVRQGNEWVLSSRFNDAKFFFEEDLQHNLDYFYNRLDRLVFQEKLGTVKAKVERIKQLVEKIAAYCEWDAETTRLALQATTLAKADLSSGMVMELPALQGIVGAEYARREGFSEYVAEAIEQHYMPKTAADVIPENLLARAISVSDRIDTLVGYLGLGFMPTGSSDPFALRRAAQGIVDILAEQDDFPYVYQLMDWAKNAYSEQNTSLPKSELVQENLTALTDARVTALLDRESIRYDIIRAAMGGAWHGSLKRLVARAKALQELASDAKWTELVTTAIRPANILRSAKDFPSDDVSFNDINPALFEDGSENALLMQAQALESELQLMIEMSDYHSIYNALLQLSAPINAFFDNVMVMDKDPDKRANRLKLLKSVNQLIMHFGDMTQVVIEG